MIKVRQIMIKIDDVWLETLKQKCDIVFTWCRHCYARPCNLIIWRIINSWARFQCCILMSRVVGVQYVVHNDRRLWRFHPTTICRQCFAESDVSVKKTCRWQVALLLYELKILFIYLFILFICLFNVSNRGFQNVGWRKLRGISWPEQHTRKSKEQTPETTWTIPILINSSRNRLDPDIPPPRTYSCCTYSPR